MTRRQDDIRNISQLDAGNGDLHALHSTVAGLRNAVGKDQPSLSNRIVIDIEGTIVDGLETQQCEGGDHPASGAFPIAAESDHCSIVELLTIELRRHRI